MIERGKNLHEMLSGLRKDPFDEDLENNDGSFSPCKFCGDPYPVEFTMRHQVILIRLFVGRKQDPTPS